MAEFSIGDAVVVSVAEGQQIGEVVCVRSFGDESLFDVSLEQMTVKGRLAAELRLAEAQEIEALLGEHTAAIAALEDECVTAGKQRDSLLRQEYLQGLGASLRKLHRRVTPAQPSKEGFEIGEKVVVARDASLLLGTVNSKTQHNGSLVLQVEVEGDLEAHGPDELTKLADYDFGDLPFSLAEHCRLFDEDHTDDPNFDAIVCRIDEVDGAPLYSIAFTDGDIFEGLESKDLLHLD